MLAIRREPPQFRRLTPAFSVACEKPSVVNPP